MSDEGSWGFKGLKGRALEFPSAPDVEPAPSGRARMRYNPGTGELEASLDGAPFEVVQVGAAPAVSRFFPANYNQNAGRFRVRTQNSNGDFNYTFVVPDEATTVISIDLIGFASSGGATGPNKNIDLFSEFGGNGQPRNLNAQADTGTLYTIPPVNELFTIDLLPVFVGVAGGDRCGIEVDHTNVGGNISYLGINISYTTS